MFKFIFNIRIIYILWVIFNCVLLYIAGYIQRVTLAFLNQEWEEFTEVNYELYPFQTENIEHYDFIEFGLYCLIPLFLFKILARMFK